MHLAILQLNHKFDPKLSPKMGGCNSRILTVVAKQTINGQKEMERIRHLVKDAVPVVHGIGTPILEIILCTLSRF
jgi:hypothetical protein